MTLYIIRMYTTLSMLLLIANTKRSIVSLDTCSLLTLKEAYITGLEILRDYPLSLSLVLLRRVIVAELANIESLLVFLDSMAAAFGGTSVHDWKIEMGVLN